MRVSWDSLFGNLFRACPSPFGRGWREAPGKGRKRTLIRPFGPPSPRGRRTRASISANLDTTAPRGERDANVRLALWESVVLHLFLRTSTISSWIFPFDATISLI